MDTTERRDSLLRIIRDRGQLSIAELAATLEVSEDTIQTDLAALRERAAGQSAPELPRTAAPCELPPASVLAQADISELLAMLFSAAVARSGSWTPFAAKAEGALSSLERALPHAHWRELCLLRSRILVGAPASATIVSNMQRVEPDLLDAFQYAFSRGFLLTFEYCDANGHASERRIEPQAMLVRAPFWYIVAWDRQKAAPRLFRMDRVRSARVVEDMRFSRRPVGALSAMGGRRRSGPGPGVVDAR